MLGYNISKGSGMSFSGRLRAKVPSFLIHFFNYFGSNIATRAVSFISIPVFTRLLSTSDYGILSLYATYVGIFGVLMTLNTHNVIGRYYYDKTGDEDFRNFVGTVFYISLACICAFLLAFFLLPEFTARLLALPRNIIIYIPVAVIIGISSSVFSQIMQPLYQSRKLALVSIFSTYASFGLAVALIFFLQKNKYMAQVWAQLFVGLLLFMYYIRQIRPYINFTYKAQYLKYIFGYSLPLIPYSLNAVILNQIDRVMINSYEGASSVGMYSFAYNIAMLMTLFVSSLNQAWIPKYFEYMNKKEYEAHDRDVYRLNKIVILGGGCLMLLGREIGVVLADKKFHAALGIIPIVVLGYVFEGIFTIYGRNIGYSRKTGYATLIAFISGLLNIVLNVILIPRYGYMVAAWTTLASYAFMAFAAYLVSKYFLKIHFTPIWRVLQPVFLLFLLIPVIDMVGTYSPNFFLSVAIKIALCGLLVFILFPDMSMVRSLFKKES